MTPRIRVRAGACLLTALGVLNSGGDWLAPGNRLAGDEPAAQRTSESPWKESSRTINAPRSRSDILQAANSQPRQPAAQSASVQKRLQELYERDGRQMPNMNLQEMPAPPAAAQGPAAGAQPNIRNNNTATVAQPQYPPQRKKGFFDRMIPGFMRKPEAPPQRPNVQGQRPAMTPPPQQYQQPPAMVAQPPSPFPGASPAAQPQRPTAQMTQPAAPAQRAPGNFRIPKNSPSEPVLLEEALAGSENLSSTLESLEAAPESVAQPAPAAAPAPAVVVNKPRPKAPNGLDVEEKFFADEEPDVGGKPKIVPKAVAKETPKVTLEAEELAPAPSRSGSDAPKLDAADEVASPFTGLKLDAESKELGIASQPQKPSTQVGMATSTAGSRVSKLGGKNELAGLKGFCLVTLKNDRKLVLTLAEHKSEYMEHSYTFASAEAKAAFDASPALYVPTHAGKDVVRLADGNDEAEGTLDYAVWYKGRLYMFSNEVTLNTFTASPAKFVVKE